jgi:hypothetical protein
MSPPERLDHGGHDPSAPDNDLRHVLYYRYVLPVIRIDVPPKRCGISVERASGVVWQRHADLRACVCERMPGDV